MRVTTELIDKERALELLAMNTGNRPATAKHTLFLTEQMKSGAFKTTGQTIQVSKTNVLLDGQHRLQAIVNSDTIQEFIIVWDLPDDVFTVLDRGKTRTAADVLAIAGIAQYSAKAALAKSILTWNTGAKTIAVMGNGSVKGQNTTPEAIYQYLKQNPLEEEMAVGNRASRVNKATFFSIPQWGFLYHILSQKSAQDASKYLEMLSSGVNLPKGHILDVRNKLIDAQINPMRRLTPKTKMIMVFKSWNLFRKGKETGKTFVGADETFPDLL